MGVIRRALAQKKKETKVRGAMPGHKGHLTLDLSLDFTELSGLDNLQAPQGILKEAQEQGAKVYGAAGCRFLVNGSTSGNYAMIFAYLKEGQTVLVERNCHKSIHNGLALARVKAHYLWPRGEDLSLGLPMREEEVLLALEEHPEISSVILTNPSYNGYIASYDRVYEKVCQRQGVLLIDGAHGAHLPAIRDFSEIYQSCHAVTLSAHKSLSCPNMGAMILFREASRGEAVQRASNLFQSTSPSYPLLMAIEEAIEKLTTGVFEKRPWADIPLNAGDRFGAITVNPQRPGFAFDPWKILLYLPGGGYELARRLEDLAINVEYAKADEVLLMMSPDNQREEWLYLKESLQRLADDPLIKEGESSVRNWRDEVPQPKKIREPWQVRERKLGSLSSASGKVAAEQIVVYPPGVPIVVPGEEITLDILQTIEGYLKEGHEILGLKEDQLWLWEEESWDF